MVWIWLALCGSFVAEKNVTVCYLGTLGTEPAS